MEEIKSSSEADSMRANIAFRSRRPQARDARRGHSAFVRTAGNLAVTLSAQGPKSGAKPGAVRPLSEVKFPSGEGPDCLQFFLETDDLKTGPSTAIMKAAQVRRPSPLPHRGRAIVHRKRKRLHRNAG
jgi:hypothetical protein